MTRPISAGLLGLWLACVLCFVYPSISTKGADSSPSTTNQTALPKAEAASAMITNEVDRASLTLKLMESVKADEKRLEGFQQRLNDPESEYAKAEKEASELNTEVEKLDAQLAQFEKNGQTPDSELTNRTATLQKRLELARERFGAALEERKALQEQIKLLQAKNAKDKEILARLTGTSTTNQIAAEVASNPPPPTAAAPTNAEEAPRTPTLPGPIGAAAKMATSSTPTNAPVSSATTTQVMSLELREAKEAETSAQAAAEKAREAVQLSQDKIIVSEKEIEAEERLLTSARKKLAVAQEQKSSLKQELQQKTQQSAPAAELDVLRNQIREAEKRIQVAQTEVEEHEQQLAKQEESLEELRRITASVTKAAQAKESEATSARTKVLILENPLHPRNLLAWVRKRGPSILVILVLMALGNLLLSFVCRHLVKIIARASSRGTSSERENRGATLVGVFQSTATLIIIVGGILLILEQGGVPVGPLLGGAAIIGLAVAFGAQRLVADFFHGFVMILENQYKVNDVIKVAGISGLVERISIRVTVLRDLEGILHFIPNSEIKTVSNMTHGWSRALFEIGVAYKEDADRVMDILMELGRELRKDEKFGSLTLDDPQMLGVDAMSDSAIIIKFFIKTRPLQQWTVKREMLRRIKRRFDELGIEIPFPHRTIYMRTESTPPIESEPTVDLPKQRQHHDSRLPKANVHKS